MGRRPRQRRPSVGDVLAGRASVDVHQLVALINDVNPTGRGLAAREEQRRYREKARLQSLLVRLHEEHVHVEESQPGVVAFSLAATGERAAHCPLDELDEDARARVRYRLDVGPDETTSDPVPVAAAARQEGYAVRAEAALEAYLYPEAQAILQGARASAPSDPGPVALLTELLVDRLGQNDRALELFASLAGAMRRDERIGGPIAVAAARVGDVALSRELLDVLARGERATEAWGCLAAWALAHDDATLAQEARDALTAMSPAHPRIRTVDEYLDARADREREAAEARLTAAEACGAGADELGAIAQDIVSRHGHSPVATRLLRQLEEQTKRDRIADLLDGADARAHEDPAAAVSMWREALALGADPAPFAERLREAEARSRSEAASRTAEELVALFEQGRSKTALARSLRAGSDVRATLRRRLEPSSIEALARAERIARSDPSARSKAVAGAALAFDRAARQLDAGDFVGSERTLRRHAKLLGLLPELSSLEEGIEVARRADLRARAERELEGARAALDRGDLDEAQRAVDRLRALELDADIEAAQVTLAARVRELAHVRAFEASVEAYEQRGAWLAAASACESELERIDGAKTPPARASALSRRAERARTMAREHHRFALLDVGSLDASLPPFGCGSGITSPHTAWAPDGLWLCVTGGAGWILVRWIDASTGALARLCCMRPPRAAPNATPTSARMDGDRLSIATTDGFVHTIDARRGRLCGSIELEGTADDPNPVLLIDGDPVAWHLDLKTFGARVLDTRTGRCRRTVPDIDRLLVVPGQPRVIRFGEGADGHWLEAFDARGARHGQRVTLPGEAIAVRGCGAKLYALCVCAAGGEVTYVVVEGEPATGECAPVIDLGAQEALAWGLEMDGGAAFVCRMEGTRTVVEAYALDPGAGAERRWSLDLAHIYVGPVRDGRLPMLVPRPSGQRAISVSLEAPDLPDGGVPLSRWTGGPSVQGSLPLTEEAHEEVRRAQEKGWCDPSWISTLCDLALLYAEQREADSLLVVLGRLRYTAPELLAQVLDQLATTKDPMPELQTWLAQRAMDRGRWRDAAGWLDGVEPALRDGGARALWTWCRYARGLVHYAEAELELALARWTELEGEDDATTRARANADFVRRLHAEEAAEETFGIVLAAVRRSDERANGGDRRAAIGALDHHTIWLSNDEQSFARLADLHLDLEDPTPSEWLRTLEVAAELLERDARPRRMVLAIPGAHWSEERIRSVGERAARWLREARPPS